MPPQAAIPGAAPAPANPTPAAPGATLAAGGFPEPAPDGPPEATQIVLRRAGEAADAALRRFSVPRTAVGEGSEEPVDPVTGEGAVTPQVYEQLVRRVDPDGRLAPHMRNAALLAEGYSFFRERGQPGDQQRAAVFAQRIVMAQRQMAQTLGALSLEALEGGDTAAACRLLGDACNMFPSGHQVQVQPSGQNGAIYRVVRDGEVVTSGSLDSSQLWGMAGEVANGRLFLREVMDFAANNRVPPPDPPSHAHYQPVNSAYVAFRRARETYENMLDSEADPTEMRAAQARMREAEQKYNEALVAAQDAGVSRADLEARSARALQDAPTDRDPPPGERRDTADTPRMTNDEHFDRLAQVVRGYQATTAEYERLSALPPGHRDRPDDVELARLHGELLGQHRQIEAFSREARDAGVSEADLRRHIADTRSSPLPERAGSNAQGRLERAARAYQAYQEAVLAVPTRGTPGQDQAAEVQRLRREYEDAVASAVSYGDSRQTVVAQAAAITERRMLDPAVEPVPSAPAGPPGRPVLVMGPGLRPEAPRGQPPAAIPYPQPRPQR